MDVFICPAFRLGPVCRGQYGEVLSFLRPTVHTIIECPRYSGDNHGWVVSAARTGCALGHRATTIRACAAFDENSCAISITSPRSLCSPRTQQVWWDHREKSRRASTLWDCRGKSRLPEKVRQTGPDVNAVIGGGLIKPCNSIFGEITFLCKLDRAIGNKILYCSNCRFQSEKIVPLLP